MSVLRVAIADDEPMARLRLQRLFATLPDVDVVATCANAEELLQALRAQPADAVFLDIEMPGRDGFAAWHALAVPRPRVVFVTAYAEFAARAFDIDACDYLVKPVGRDRLEKALQRLRRDLATPPPVVAPRRIALSIGRRVRLVDLDAIEHVVAQANYLEIHAQSRCFVLRRPISWMESQLDGARFARVHRSHIVRMDTVEQVEPLPSGRYRLRLKDGRVLFSSRSYRDALRRSLGLA
ncbi:MAG: hypothetical protein BGP24_17345 [Lysobacterales bacterium 69-70]|nr:response regulator transcription factor [Xanthomonadaceae bacterium]ODU30741.1 MAG: hypothetical protein ABS97_20685 [Xanthomonadaceae bacterium SCN 69-320]ODV17671.1 MAG: hypothetical protein ABT27_16525 [Xanthomonadaceae bacterium SCN 69-25]OJZ00280.1 MAG: hypothetical protein BGP24_17345 [Xanthomonadales bacterium 69-70]